MLVIPPTVVELLAIWFPLLSLISIALKSIVFFVVGELIAYTVNSNLEPAGLGYVVNVRTTLSWLPELVHATPLSKVLGEQESDVAKLISVGKVM